MNVDGLPSRKALEALPRLSERGPVKPHHCASCGGDRMLVPASEPCPDCAAPAAPDTFSIPGRQAWQPFWIFAIVGWGWIAFAAVRAMWTSVNQGTIDFDDFIFLFLLVAMASWFVMWFVQRGKATWLTFSASGAFVHSGTRSTGGVRWDRIARVLVYAVDAICPPDGIRRWIVVVERRRTHGPAFFGPIEPIPAIRFVFLATNKQADAIESAIREQLTIAWGGEPGDQGVPYSLGEQPSANRNRLRDGMRSCVHCGYPIANNAIGAKCSECGLLAGHERVVVQCGAVRTSIRRFANGVALLMAAGNGVAALALLIAAPFMAAPFFIAAVGMWWGHRYVLRGFTMQIGADSVVFHRVGRDPHTVSLDIVVDFRPIDHAQTVVRIRGTAASEMPPWVPREFIATMTAPEIEQARANLDARRAGLAWREVPGGARLESPYAGSTAREGLTEG